MTATMKIMMRMVSLPQPSIDGEFLISSIRVVIILIPDWFADSFLRVFLKKSMLCVTPKFPCSRLGSCPASLLKCLTPLL
jgi:hypothetical protein